MKLKTLIKIIGPLIFLYILSRIDFGELALAFKNINLRYFVVSFLVFFFHILLRTFKWKMLVDSLGTKISFSKAFSMFSQGVFWGSITPGRVGEFSRANTLSKELEISLRKAFWTVIMDRIIDLLVAASVSLVAVLVLVRFIKIQIPWLVSLFLLLIFFVLIYFLTKKKQTENILKFFLRIIVPEMFKNKTQEAVAEFFEDSKKITVSFFSKLFIFELFYYFFMALALFFLGLSLNLSIPVWYLFLIDPFIALVAVLPISILGLGTRELSYAFLLAPLGIGLSQSVGFSLFVFLFTILTGLPGLVFYLTNKGENKAT